MLSQTQQITRGAPVLLCCEALTLCLSPGKLQLLTSHFYFVTAKIWPRKVRIGRPHFGKSLQGLPQ